MAKITVTPTPQAVFNDFDRDGLTLGLSRILQEKNADYKRRLQNVFVHRGGSQYRELINAVTRELGLEIIEALSIVPLVDGNGDPLAPFPGIVFKDTKCYIYNDYTADDIVLTLDRFEPDSGAFTLQELVDQINGTALYSATLLTGTGQNLRAMNVFNQSSIIQVFTEDIASSGVRVHLANNNLIPDSIALNSPNVYNSVASTSDIKTIGDYYLDLADGILYTYSTPTPGSVIRYKARQDNFIVEASPVILHNLQSDDFKTKMYQQTSEGDNGLPNQLGADIINELISVFPYGYGK